MDEPDPWEEEKKFLGPSKNGWLSIAAFLALGLLVMLSMGFVVNYW